MTINRNQGAAKSLSMGPLQSVKSDGGTFPFSVSFLTTQGAPTGVARQGVREF